MGSFFVCDLYICCFTNLTLKKRLLFLVFIGLLITANIGCHQKQREQGFSYHPLGYYYQLISFDADTGSYHPDKVSWVAASFKTQSDSVFWDSHNNLNDKFYLVSDSLEQDNFFKNYVARCSALDSGCVLIKTKDFYRQQFKTNSVPFFSRNDSVVRVNFKVKDVLTKDDFIKIQYNLREKEEKQIERYYGTFAEMEASADRLGFYWLDRSGGTGEAIPQPGDQLTIVYRGEYLNGRFLEKSSADFDLVYGTPDQILKGLNFVIGYLKKGESAKIILPSRLAFGESGSSNGTVLPYTPLVYEIKLIDLKTSGKNP